MKEIKKMKKINRKRKPPPKQKTDNSPLTHYDLPVTRSTTTEPPRYRIVDWFELKRQLETCVHCGNGPLDLNDTKDENKSGLMYKLKVDCKECGCLNTILTDKVHSADSHGPTRSEVNERCVLGTLHSGNGHAQLDHLLSTMDIECLFSKTFKNIERRVGPEVEQVARESCKESLNEELRRTGTVDLAISYDMGWQKRGKARNSKTGQGTAVGSRTGKIVDYATMNNSCRVCEYAVKTSSQVQEHDCRRNHTGSSKSMESAAAVKIYMKGKEMGVQYSTFIGDEDSTTIAHVKDIAGKYIC